MLGWDHGQYSAHPYILAMAVGVSLVGIVAWGSLAGAMLPFHPEILQIRPGDEQRALRGNAGRRDRVDYLFHGGGVDLPAAHRTLTTCPGRPQRTVVNRRVGIGSPSRPKNGLGQPCPLRPAVFRRKSTDGSESRQDPSVDDAAGAAFALIHIGTAP